MKRVSLLVPVLLGVLVFLPIAVFAENNEGDGEYVHEAVSNGSKPNIPAGHFGILAKYADEFLSTGPGGERTIYANTLLDGYDDPRVADELKDFFILDIRLAADYCRGHIAGAINVPLSEVAKPANLSLLPTDKPILIVDATGHTASVANAILGMLGYNAWTLRFGMTSWMGSTGTKVWSSRVSQTIYGAGFRIERCAQ